MDLNAHIRKLLSAVLMVMPLISYAQWFGSKTDRINTLRVVVDGDWERPAIVNMASDEKIEFSFDEMSHEYHRFTYRIQHCDAQWQPSEILESDFLDGFNDETIDDWENSLNTTFDYTHYRLTIPNEKARLKLSGNYRLSIREDGREVAYFRFCVSEGKILLSCSVSGNTDIDTHDSHQQLDLTVNYGSLTVRDPAKELYTVVMQNRRTDNMVINPTPTYDVGNKLTYEHCRDLIFAAGNEFRRFEVVNLYDYFMNVDRVSFHDPFYHATLMQDTRRHAYKFDHDHNGRYLIRYSQGNSDTEADYLFMHFNLASERLRAESFTFQDISAEVTLPPDMRWNTMTPKRNTRQTYCSRWEHMITNTSGFLTEKQADRQNPLKETGMKPKMNIKSCSTTASGAPATTDWFPN